MNCAAPGPARFSTASTEQQARRSPLTLPSLVFAGASLIFAACGDGVVADLDAANTFPDASQVDSNFEDAAEPIFDLGNRDASQPPDLGARDTGSPDLGPSDVGTPDLGTPDLGPSDVGTPDLGTPDLGTPDVGTTDAGLGEPVPADMIALLDLMNAARLATGSAPLTWHPDVAATADTWAAGCTWEHAPANQRLYMGTQMGENLGAGSGTGWTPAALGQGWVDEETFYDCATNSCAIGEICGHYTQIIWRNSTAVGCAIRTCTTGSPFGSGTPSWRFLVCRFLPAGNYNNQRPIPVGDCP